MEDGKVEVLVQGNASAPIKQTVAMVVNAALKEAGFTEVVLSHVVAGVEKEIGSPMEQETAIVTVLDLVAGAYPHLFTTPVGIRVLPDNEVVVEDDNPEWVTKEPIPSVLSIESLGHTNVVDLFATK